MTKQKPENAATSSGDNCLTETLCATVDSSFNKKLIKVMKNKPKPDIFLVQNVKKIFLTMKFTILLFLVSIFTASATDVFSQNALITLEMRDAKVRDVVNEIEKIGGINFLYNDDLPGLNKHISLSFVDKPIKDVLFVALNQADMTFLEIKDNFVVLLDKEDLARQQQIIITGRVTDEHTGESLPGVSIVIQGTTTGVTSDADGNYRINVPNMQAVLKFSFVGYKEKIVPVEQNTLIDVALAVEMKALDEVVVTGYATQRRRDITGSISSVRATDLEGMPVISLQKAMQGRAAGVQITAGDGVPGGHVSVIVRGIGSFASNTPLYIVDGVEVHSGSIGGRTPSESILSAIDFNDIETMDILKDASASAIYGAKGAAGVIIITTKRGKASDKTDFSFELSRGFTSPTRLMPVMTGPQWAQWDAERFANRYGLTASQYLNRIQLGVTRGWYELGSDGQPDYSTSPNYNWQDEAYRQGNIVEARVTARGGSPTTRFYTAISHNNTEGHVIKYDFSRTSFRLNLDHDASNKLKFDTQINANLTKQNTTRLEGAFSSPVRAGAGIPPVEPIYDDEGNWFGAPRSVFGAYPSHFLNSAFYDFNTAMNVKGIINMGATYNITKDLAFRSAFGVDYNHSDEEQWYDPRASDGLAANGALRNYETSIYSVQTTQTLNYNHVFAGSHSINGVIGWETYERIYRRTAVTGENFPNPNINVIDAAALAVWWGGDETERANMGAFGRLHYTYDDRYILTLTSRYDGSSRFGAETKWGFFPAIAAGWRMSSEKFMSSINKLDNLMLKLSYGTSGTDASGTYAALGLWSGGTQYMGDVGLYPTQLPNERLTWEESTTLNLAVSAALFRGKLSVDFDIFRRWSEQLLLARPLPPTTGWTSITENIGRTLNEGVELTVNSTNFQRGRFAWRTNFNFTYVRNEILELLPGQDFFSDRRAVGRSIDDYYINIWAGVNPADGRPMYYDKDWNITYQPTAEDRHWVGPIQPKVFGGLTNEISYAGLSASFFFQYSGGSYRYLSDARYWFCGTGDRNQYSRVYTDRWLTPGQITDVPKPVYANVYPGSVQSPNVMASHMLERVDYIRLKDVSLQYTIPRKYTERYGVTGFTLFARGTNLVTWTDYSGTDPEFTGSDFGVYPQGKSFTVGLKTNF